jgi:hypothetical protein
MSLATRLADFITAVGTDIKSLQAQINALTSSTDPWTYRVVAADVTNSTTTAGDITGLTIPTSLATGKYILEGKIFFTSAAATTGIQLGFTFPAQVDLAAMWQIPAGVGGVNIHHQTVTAVYSGSTAAPAAAPADFVGVVDGVFVVNSAMSAAIIAQQRSEIAGSAVVTKAGSFIRYRKIA